MAGAQLVELLLHLGAQMVLNPGVGGLQAVGLKDAPNLSLYPGSVAGEAQKVVTGKLNEELTVYLSLKR